MAESKQQLMSIGVFLLIIVAAIVLFLADLISWMFIVPVVLAVGGVWILVLAVMRGLTSQKYGRGAFSTMNMGLLLLAVGGAWYLLYVNWLYSLALLLLVLGAIAIAAALKRK